jgi:N-acetylneuraminic acid mutarotase
MRRRLSFAALGLAALALLQLFAWNYSRLSLGIREAGTAAGHFGVAAPLPAARTEAGGAACGGFLYLVGGIGGFAETYASAYRYAPASDRWERIADLPAASSHTGVVCADGELYAAGGFGPLGLRLRGFMFARWDPQDALYRYDAAANHWIPLATLPEARGAGGFAATPGELWYAGGIRPDLALASDLFRYDIAAQRWTREAPMPTPRDHLRLEALGGSLYAISGRQDDLRFNLPDVERFDLATRSWSAVASHPSPRGGMASAVFGGRIYTFGGELTWHCHEGIEVYDPAADRWRTIGPLPEARHGIVAGVLADRIHLVSGGRLPRVSVSRIHRVFEAPGE